MSVTKEEDVWKGHPSQWMNFGYFLLCILLIWLVVPLFLLIWRWLETRMTVYRLTTQRLFCSTGVFSRKTEVIELYRIRDMKILQPFLMRLVGLGVLWLDTSDHSAPQIALRGVADVEGLAQNLRTHVEACRMAKGTREIDFAQ